MSTPSKTASVEFAARNGKAGQRIVLDDADESAGPHHAPHLVHEMRPFGWRDVVQHADRVLVRIENCPAVAILMLDKVVVDKDAIRISGPKSVLAHQLTAEKPLPPSLVPTFVDV